MLEIQKRIQKNAAFCMYFLVPLFWGLTFPLIKISVAHISAAYFVWMRFLLAALLLLPLVRFKKSEYTEQLLWVTVLLAILNIATFWSQSIALESISSTRAAFITSLSVVFVPFLSLFFGLNKPKMSEYVAAGLSLLGIYFLTGADLFGLSYGDAWVLLCALTSALTIMLMHRLSAMKTSPLNFTFYQILLTGFLMSPLLLSQGFSALDAQIFISLHSIVIIGALCFCASFATVFAIMLQIRYQHQLTETKAALILMLEPVFAAFFASVFFHEKLSWMMVVGGGFVLLSTFMVEIIHLFQKYRYRDCLKFDAV